METRQKEKEEGEKEDRQAGKTGNEGKRKRRADGKLKNPSSNV